MLEKVIFYEKNNLHFSRWENIFLFPFPSKRSIYYLLLLSLLPPSLTLLHCQQPLTFLNFITTALSPSPSLLSLSTLHYPRSRHLSPSFSGNKFIHITIVSICTFCIAWTAISTSSLLIFSHQWSLLCEEKKVRIYVYNQ